MLQVLSADCDVGVMFGSMRRIRKERKRAKTKVTVYNSYRSYDQQQVVMFQRRLYDEQHKLRRIKAYVKVRDSVSDQDRDNIVDIIEGRR